ncbi:MAG: hypothetical protein HZY75_11915 [Nocardioidaceae bacterium]|nr:MAG: hypothetical protein HZY75_11915 [Nocardioidaceae bacterium]
MLWLAFIPVAWGAVLCVRWRGGWRLLAAPPVLVIGGLIVISFVLIAAQPDSNSLFPLFPILLAIPATIYLGVLAAAHSATRGLTRAAPGRSPSTARGWYAVIPGVGLIALSLIGALLGVGFVLSAMLFLAGATLCLIGAYVLATPHDSQSELLG